MQQSAVSSALERRAWPTAELRLADKDGKAKLQGHAAVFNTLSVDLGGFREQISPGAFAESVQRDDIRALFHHNPLYVLGRTKPGTLRLWEDAKGLAFELDLPDTSSGRDMRVMVERGDVTGMSFGFRTGRDSWRQEQDGLVRTLEKVQLFDVSPTAFPAYPDTDVALRAMAAWQRDLQAAPDPTLALRRRHLDMALKI